MPKEPVFIPEHLRRFVKDEPWRPPPWFALAAAALLVPLVYYIQQFTLNLRGMTYATVPREVAAREEPVDPGIAELTLSAKMMVKVAHLSHGSDEGEADEESSLKPDSLDKIAVTRVDRLRVAIAAGEVEGSKAATTRLDALAKEAEPGGDLASEITWLRKLYTDGPDSLTPEARQSLIDRHGWFGELAVSYGRGMVDANRRRLVGGALKLGGIALSIGAGAILAFIAGVILLFVAARRKADGAMASGMVEIDPEPIYAEMFAVFIGAFLLVLLLTLLMFGVHAEATPAALAFEEVLTWLLLGAAAWPFIRGLPWARISQELGLYTGRGIVREVLCGIGGWLVSVPISVGVGLLIGFLAGESDARDGPRGYPLFEPPAGASWGMLWLGVLSAVIWAPLVEEVIFRGALYAYLRPRLRWLGATIVVSALFGLCHPYTTAGLVQVGIMGVVLALLREWRGSLIAPMVCHFLHNATISLVTIAIIAAID